MRVTNSIDLLSETKNIKEIFPYFYYPEFSQLLKILEQKKVILVIDDEGISMACKVWKN